MADGAARLQRVHDYPALLAEAWAQHLAPRDANAPTVISTFAGCGGSSLGYHMAGFRELLAVEWEQNAADTFRLNFPDVPLYHGDIAKLSVAECLRLAGVAPGELDVFDGSPPCQGFSTSGTRDALKELVLEAGCKTNPEMAALKETDEDRYKQICTEVRDDGAYVDQGEQDNLIVQKIEGNPNAVGVFGYSYLEENADRAQGLSMNGIAPTYENIASFAYPGARPLYVYVKTDHVDAVPGLREFLATWAESWGVGGVLAQIGLVASPDDVMARSAAAVTELPLLTAADFE